MDAYISEGFRKKLDEMARRMGESWKGMSIPAEKCSLFKLHEEQPELQPTPEEPPIPDFSYLSRPYIKKNSPF